MRTNSKSPRFAGSRTYFGDEPVAGQTDIRKHPKNKIIFNKSSTIGKRPTVRLGSLGAQRPQASRKGVSPQLKSIYLKSPHLHRLAPEKILKVLQNRTDLNLRQYSELRTKNVSETELEMVSNQIKRQRLNNRILHQNIQESEKTLRNLQVKLQKIKTERKRSLLPKSLAQSRLSLLVDSTRRSGLAGGAEGGLARRLGSMGSLSNMLREKLRDRQNKVINSLIREDAENQKLEDRLKEIVGQLKDKTDQIKREEKLLEERLQSKRKKGFESRLSRFLLDMLAKRSKGKKVKAEVSDLVADLSKDLVK